MDSRAHGEVCELDKFVKVRMDRLGAEVGEEYRSVTDTDQLGKTFL
jgi:hypothetical protein